MILGLLLLFLCPFAKAGGPDIEIEMAQIENVKMDG